VATDDDDFYSTYLIERRDVDREARLSPSKQAIFRSWISARAKLARAARGAVSARLPSGVSVSLLPPKFLTIYENLEAADESEMDEWSRDIQELSEAVREARGSSKADRAERAYEKQAVVIDTARTHAERERRLRGKRVWLYHGTSSALLPEIVEHGLLPTQDPIDPDTTTEGYVYLTGEPGDWSSGGSAWFYARRAAAHFGGQPIILRVIVDFDDLEPDMDDADLRSFDVQYRTENAVPVGAIMEIDGERLRERYGR
jgi:hypothetical protein